MPPTPCSPMPPRFRFAYRVGKFETLDRAESGDLGLRVLIGKKQAIVSATDRGEETLEALVSRAVAMAKAAPEDEFCGLADAELTRLRKTGRNSVMADDAHPDVEKLIAQAREAWKPKPARLP